MGKIRLVMVVLLALVVLAVAACAVPVKIVVGDLQIGDCFNSEEIFEVERLGRGPIETVELVSCDEVWRYRVYDSFEDEEELFPGHGYFKFRAGNECRESFSGAVLHGIVISPTEEKWRDGNRRTLCIEIRGMQEGHISGVLSKLGIITSMEKYW